MTNEILVHISKPTTSQTDDIYRSLANAYLDFEPYRTLEDPSLWRKKRANARLVSEKNDLNAASGNTSMPESADTSVFSTSKDSYGSFPSHLSFEEQCKTDELASTQEISSLNDSPAASSSRLAHLEHIYTEWKQQKTPKSSIVDEVSRPSTRFEDPDTTFIEDTQLAAQALQSQLCGSNLDFTNCRVSCQDELESRSEHSHASDIEHDLHSSSHEMSQTPSKTIDFARLPADAFPPAPEVSIIEPNILPSQITTYLAAIQAQNPRRFRPINSIYCPKPDDRGYWSIDCSTWPLRIQYDFWSALSEHVRSGRLGWGITLHRENGSSQTLGSSKLYCWGEVVEHLWLVLWLCSHGKVSGTGSKWIDADGVVAILMP